MLSVKRNFIFNILLIGSNIIFPILVFPYIAHVLGPEGLGNAHFAMQFSKYFMLTASLGIPIYGVREVAKAKDNKEALHKLVSELILLNLITAIISSIVYAIVIFTVPLLQQNIALFAVAGLQVVLGFLSIDWLFSGLEDFRIITIRSVLMRILTVIFLVWLVKQPDDVFNYLVLVVSGVILGHLLNVVYALSKVKITFSGLNMSRHFKPIFLIFLMNVCITMYTVFDTAWIGFLGTAASIGMYTSAIKLTKIGIPIVTALGTVLIPKSARNFAADIKHPQHLTTSYNFIVDLAIPIGFGLFYLAPELLRIFSGVAFEQAVTAMRLFSFLPLIIGLNNLFGMQILSASGNDKLLLVAVFFGMLINVVLNVLLIPHFLHNGAALAMLLTESSVMLITLYYANKKFAIPFRISRMLKSAVISCLFIPVMYLSKQHVHSGGLLILFNVITCSFIYAGLQYWVFKNEFMLIFINLVQRKTNLASKNSAS